jgi:hypothetical protein
MAGIEIDGREYPVPSVFQLTMGEAQVLYDYSGYTVEDFVPPVPGDPDEERMARVKNPAFKRAMVHVAYQRGNPDAAHAEVAKVVDGLEMWGAILDMLVDNDADPTSVSQNKPENSQPSETSSTDGSSGRRSSTKSGEQAVTLVPTGTTG